jgi:hypothetical protein
MRLVHYKEGKIGLEKLASGRNRVAIVDNPGRIWIYIVMLDGDHLEVRKLRLEEQRWMTDITSLPRIKLTPLQSVAKRWLKRTPTAQAEAILRRAAA